MKQGLHTILTNYNLLLNNSTRTSRSNRTCALNRNLRRGIEDFKK